MTRPLVPVLVLVALVPAAAQETRYGEFRVAPSRVPPSVVKAAEQEAPAARLTYIYRDLEKGHRFVGKAADGRTYVVQIDRAGAVVGRHIYADVPAARLPKPVSAAVRDEVARNKDLAGFRPTKASLVERYDARKNETATYYEVRGEIPPFRQGRLDVAETGAILKADTNAQRSLEDLSQEEAVAGKDIPPAIRQGIAAASAEFTPTRVFRVSSRRFTEVRYEAYGRMRDGRWAQVSVLDDGTPLILAVTIPLAQAPRAARDAIAREAAKDQQLAGFQPTMARLRHTVWPARDSYEFYGENGEGRPLWVTVDQQGTVFTVNDFYEPLREAAGFVTPRARPAGTPPAEGFAVLAARYGRFNWIDVTDFATAAASSGVLKSGIGGGLPDPNYGVKKAMAVLFSIDGKVGLTVEPEGEMKLPPKAAPASLAQVPPRGFAVLAARYGAGESWADVTGAIRARAAGGKLDVPVSELKLPDPAPNEAKALVVAFADDGVVGLHHFADGQRAILPWALPPANSSALEVRRVEFLRTPRTVAFGPDGRVVVGIDDGTVRVVEAGTGRESRLYEGHGAGWVAVGLSPDGALALSGGADGTLRLWEMKSGKGRAVFHGHTGPIRRVALSVGGRLAASSSEDLTVRIWDAATGRELHKLEGHTATIDGLAFTPDGRSLLSTSWDHALKVWDAASGKLLREYRGDGGALGFLSLTRDGKSAFIGADDRTVRRVEVATARELTHYPTRCEAGLGVAVTPDARRFLAADGSAALLWDVGSDRPALRLERHTDRVRGISLAPNGRMAATVGDDHTLRIWELP